MGRGPFWESEGLRKGAWTAEEDQKLIDFVKRNNGHGSWRTLPKLAGLQRCGKSCRLRWTNYLRPNIKRGNFSAEEETSIIQLHALVGNRWAYIASHLPGRTDNEVKNHWNTHLKKRLSKMGIDPETHRPIILNPRSNYDYNLYDNPLINTNYSLIQQSNPLINTNNSAQLSLTLDQVARLLQEAQISNNNNNNANTPATNHQLVELLDNNTNHTNATNPINQLQCSILLQNYAALQQQLLNLLTLNNPYKNEELQLIIKALITNMRLINALNPDQRTAISSPTTLDRSGIIDHINLHADVAANPCNSINNSDMENLIYNSSQTNVYNCTDQITNLNPDQYNYLNINNYLQENYNINQEYKSATATSNSDYNINAAAEQFSFEQSSSTAPALVYDHGSSVTTTSCCTTPDSSVSASTANDISDPFIADLLSSDVFYADHPNNCVDTQAASATANLNNWNMINNNQCNSEMILSSNLLQEQSWADQCMLINNYI